ncbi:MAG: hypothetical protein KAK01_11125 [Candidatus Marinimicrobia bacterium]|nr:hypothetical protein [Candidatus Neomarinimicrobiota bacterium]
MSLKAIFNTLLIILVIAAGFWGCESDELAQPNPNIRPESYISEVSPGVTTRISWYGSDVDGRVEQFEYRWDDGEWVITTVLSELFPCEDVTNPYADFEFVDLDDQHTFFVRAIDNNDQVDLSPAAATMFPRTTQPETQIVEGPMTGSVVGPDVRFAWLGVDQDGSVDGFEYALDDLNAWTTVEEYITEHTFYGLGQGAHIFYIRAVDDLGAVDNSPAQSAFVVASGFKPKLANLSPVADGGGWFSGVDLGLAWEASVDYYQGVLPSGAFTYALDDISGYDLTSAQLASGWGPNSSITISGSAIGDGDHTFYVKARDVSGNVDTMSISFGAAPFAPTQDVLLLDNFSWTPDSYADQDEIKSKIQSGFLNGVSVDLRDLDDEGAGILTPALLGQYSAVILYGDGGYNGSGSGNLFAAYAGAGGNLMLTGYNLASFDIASITVPFGIYNGIFGTFGFPSGGMTGQNDASGMIQTDDLFLPVPALDVPRDCERVYNDADNTETLFTNDPPQGDGRSIGVVASMNGGNNYVFVIGQSIPFWDQDATDTKTFGDRVMALWGITDSDN